MVSVKCCDKGAYQIAFTKPDFMGPTLQPCKTRKTL